jgi:hypothetical protein
MRRTFLIVALVVAGCSQTVLPLAEKPKPVLTVAEKPKPAPVEQPKPAATPKPEKVVLANWAKVTALDLSRVVGPAVVEKSLGKPDAVRPVKGGTSYEWFLFECVSEQNDVVVNAMFMMTAENGQPQNYRMCRPVFRPNSPRRSVLQPMMFNVDNRWVTEAEWEKKVETAKP